MTIRGRAKSAPEVSVCVLAHIFGELGLQEVAMLVDDTLANHLRAFRLGDLVARSEDLSGEGVKFRVILHVDHLAARCHRYWNIKGLGHFVVFFFLNCLRFMRFEQYHFEQIVVPHRHHS